MTSTQTIIETCTCGPTQGCTIKPCHGGTLRLSEQQGLALIGARDGDLSWCNPRTIRSLHDRGLIVYLGSGFESAARRVAGVKAYRLTDAGDLALARFEGRDAS